MELLIRFLAQLFDKFKAKNPAVALVVLFVLAVIQHIAIEGGNFGVFVLPEWAATALGYIATFLMAVTGSRTYTVLHDKK